MQLNRRNTIIGLGALAGGGGLITATGAFDAVEADRSFEVEVAGDADGLLGIEVLDTPIAEYEEGGAGDNDVIGFELDDESEDGVEEGSINEDAVTEFFEVFEVTNNGSQEIELTIETDDGDDDQVDGLYFKESEDGDDLSEGIDLDQGDSIRVDIRINTRHTDDDEDGGYTEPDGDPYQITLRAESDAAQGED